MKRLLIIVILACCATALHAQQELNLNGSAFSSESKNVSSDGQNGQLAGMFSYGAAVYEFSVPQGTDRFKAAVQFVNQRHKWLKLYVYNYGGAAGETFGNKNLDPHWRLWQATDGGGVWVTANPEWVYAGAPGAKYDFAGPQHKVKLLLYADGGVPFLGDGRFLIQQVRLLCDAPSAQAATSVVPLIVTSKDAWLEGGYLLVKGVGVAAVNPNRPGGENTRRAMAIRAATVGAYRNLAVALGKIPRSGGTAQIPGSRVREQKDLGNNQYEVTIEVPLDKIK